MATKRRNVDVLSISLRSIDEIRCSFKDILTHVTGRKFNIKGKEFKLRIIDTDIQDCVVGIIETIQNTDIPPKANRQTGQIDALNINSETEGLIFANIFIYDSVRNIIIYEVNRNGCYPNQLKAFLEHYWNDEHESSVEISYLTIFKSDEYQRMLDMTRFNKIRIELCNPIEIINNYREANDSIHNNVIKDNIEAGVRGNANSIIIEQVALRKRLNPLGLSKNMVKGFVDSVKLTLLDQGQRQNVHTIKIEGYMTNPEGKNVTKAIDIVGDTFKESFRITDIKIQSNLQQSERKIAIENLYNLLLPEFRTIQGI